MKPIRIGGALAAATLCGATFAATHIVDITWPPNGRFGHTTQVAAGRFVEVCGQMKLGQSVRWNFTAGAPMDFNIHYHADGKSVFPVNQTQVNDGQDTLKVTVAEQYCWMWTNKGSDPARLTVDLAR